MREYVVGRAEDVPEGSSIAVQVGRATVAIFRVDGRFYAVHNRCQHKGASLCDGILDPKRKVVRCPWHLWDWSLESGQLAAAPERYRIPTYQVRVVDGEIRLRV